MLIYQDKAGNPVTHLHQVKGMVTKKEHDVETETTEVVEEKALPEPHATVGFKAGVTINMGDFNSTRLEVFISVPTTPDEDAMDTAFDFAKGWVDDKLQALVAEAKPE